MTVNNFYFILTNNITFVPLLYPNKTVINAHIFNNMTQVTQRLESAIDIKINNIPKIQLTATLQCT